MALDRNKLGQELKALKRGRGLTLGRLRASPNIQIAAGETDPSRLRERLVAEIDGLGGGVEARALRNAYNLDDTASGRLLEARRTDFAVANGRHEDTIEAYENAAIDDLIERLLAGRTPVPQPKLHALFSSYKGMIQPVKFFVEWASKETDPDPERIAEMMAQPLPDNMEVEIVDEVTELVEELAEEQSLDQDQRELADLVAAQVAEYMLFQMRSAYLLGRSNALADAAETLVHKLEEDVPIARLPNL